MFTNATPPLGKHRGWPRLRAIPGETHKPVCGQGEHVGLLAQGQLRRSMDPGKHTAGSATAPSLPHLWAQAALNLTVCTGQCCVHGASWGGRSWEPPVPCRVLLGYPRARIECCQPISTQYKGVKVIRQKLGVCIWGVSEEIYSCRGKCPC